MAVATVIPILGSELRLRFVSIHFFFVQSEKEGAPGFTRAAITCHSVFWNKGSTLSSDPLAA